MYNTTNDVSNRSRSESTFQTVEANKPPQSLFDLSYDHKTTFSMGQLIPFAIWETLPGDTFNISQEVMLRFEPLWLPMMHRVNLKTWYFYIPNRIIWEGPRGWEDFIADDGTKSILWAYTEIGAGDLLESSGNPNSLVEYLGFPTPNASFALGWHIEINALPIYAYHKIYNDYFRNAWIQTEYFTSATEGNNTANLDTMYTTWNQVQYRNWNPDYFTSALPTPQAGTPVMLPMFDSNFLTESGLSVEGPYRWLEWGTHAQNIVGDLQQQGTVAPYPTTRAGATDVYLDIQNTAATIAQLRTNLQMQEYLERLNRSGDRYRDTIRGFFGVDPTPGVIDFTEVIGTSSAVVQISDVMQTAYTNVETGPGSGGSTITGLGGYAGKAMGLNSSGNVQYTCQEHGWIIGIINVQPRSSYFQGLEKFWRRKTKFDYAWAEFAGIGDQKIEQYELVLDYGTFDDDDTGANTNWYDEFGYTRRFNEYRWKSDTISGEMRYVVPQNVWHMARTFDELDQENNPDLLTNPFLQCKPNPHKNFQTVDPGGVNKNHEIYAHIWNKCTVARSLPKYGIPTINSGTTPVK